MENQGMDTKYGITDPTDYGPSLNAMQSSNNETTIAVTPLSNRPRDYTRLAQFSWCCIIPMGNEAMDFARMSKEAADAGDYQKALEHGRSARNCALGAIVIGTVLCAVIITLFAVYWNDITGQ